MSKPIIYVFIIIISFSFTTIAQTNPEDFLNNGLAKSKTNDFQGAITDLTKAIELKPDYDAAFFMRGYMKCMLLESKNYQSPLEDFESAIADFSKAIEINPQKAVVYYNRGYLLSQMKISANAISDFSKAIELNKEYSDAYYGRGIEYLNIGKKPEALNDFNKAKELGMQIPSVVFDYCK